MLFTIEELKSSLLRLGLVPGDAVYVHTSLKSIGAIEGGPNGLIEAFLKALGPDGTLAVPCHSLSFTGLGLAPYDPKNSHGTTGAFPEAVRKYPGAARSAHPSHSSAAVGARAGTLTEGHQLTNPLGFDSPLHRLYRRGGKVLLLGVGHTANTSLHLAESLAGMPYTRLSYDSTWGEPYMVDDGGAVVSVPQEQYPGCSDHFDVMDELFTNKGITRYGLVGNAVCQLMEMNEMVDCTVEILREKPDFLLCYRPECPACQKRRDYLKAK